MLMFRRVLSLCHLRHNPLAFDCFTFGYVLFRQVFFQIEIALDNRHRAAVDFFVRVKIVSAFQFRPNGIGVSALFQGRVFDIAFQQICIRYRRNATFGCVTRAVIILTGRGN